MGVIEFRSKDCKILALICGNMQAHAKRGANCRRAATGTVRRLDPCVLRKIDIMLNQVPSRGELFPHFMSGSAPVRDSKGPQAFAVLLTQYFDPFRQRCFCEIVITGRQWQG